LAGLDALRHGDRVTAAKSLRESVEGYRLEGAITFVKLGQWELFFAIDIPGNGAEIEDWMKSEGVVNPPKWATPNNADLGSFLQPCPLP